MSATLNEPLRIHGNEGDALIIRQYHVESGVRIYKEILRIQMDGTVITCGELHEYQTPEAVQ